MYFIRVSIKAKNIFDFIMEFEMQLDINNCISINLIYNLIFFFLI